MELKLVVVLDRHVQMVDLRVRWNARKVVIELAMASLICPNAQDDVPEHRIIFQVVVLLGLAVGLQLCPVLKLALVQLIEENGVGVNGLLLEVSDKSVAHGWRHHVSKEVEVEEDALSCRDHQPEDDSWISHLEEEEQMHALVLRLLQ